MPYEQLIESVDECARDIIQTISEKAGRDATGILAEARGKGQSIRKKHRDSTMRSVVAERSRSISKAKKEARMQRIYAKDEVFCRAFEEAQRHFNSLRARPEYEAVFSRLLEEVLAELKGVTIRLHIDKQDEALCRRLVAKENPVCEIVADITTAGGVNAETQDGKFVVFNTVESRLEQARSILKPEIFAVLYGDEGGM
jgi:vacuolar-type H+-ATPase subunit E/Vma4